jgi:hypothetical protein
MAPKGNVHYYRLRDQELRRLSRTIFAERRAIASAVPDPKDWNTRVLSDYLVGEVLKTMPATRRKRWVILKWLAEKFALGKRYLEAEVNDLIQRH